MVDPDALNVWLEDRLVGYLWRNPIGAIGFRYEPDWINTHGFAVSRTLPLATEDFSCDASIAHRFFAKLLPEGRVRDHIVRDLKIPNTDFDLLRAIGGECAGALSILSAERNPSDERSYRPLPDKALARLVARRGQIYAALLEQISNTKALFEVQVIIHRCNASSVLSHSNATVPPAFKTASILDIPENPDQDRADRASARICVER